MILKLDGDKALLVTRPTPPVLALLGELEGRRHWLKGGGLQVENTGHNIRTLSRLPNLEIIDDTPASPDAEESVEAFDVGKPTYKPKTKPYAHQRKALAKIDGKKTFALFMEQGTGKTKVLIDWIGQLWTHGELTGVIVVSKKGVHRQWIEGEIPHHCPINSYGRFWPLKHYDPRLNKRDPKELKWLALNYDGLKTKKGKEMAQEFARAHAGKLMIIADESQEIKNHNSGRWSAIDAIKSFSSHRALATGTPLARDLTDEWSQFKWLNSQIIGIKYITAFKNQFCIIGGFTGYAVIGHRNLDQFKELTDPYVFRITKQECGLLPKQYNEWFFDLTATQKKMIQQVKRDLEATLESGQTIDIQHATVAMSKVHQIASGFIIDEDKTIHPIMPREKNPRIIAAMEWLDAVDGKAIIWARFREDMRMLHEEMIKRKIEHVEYHGGISDKNRALAVESFLKEDGARVLLANPQSAGTGLNLQGLCNHALYYTNSFNAIDRWQSEDRIHRIGTVGAVTYTDMISKGSLDRYILNNLKKKKGLSDLVLDDRIRMILDLE